MMKRRHALTLRPEIAAGQPPVHLKKAARGLTGLGPPRPILDPERLSAIFATPVVRAEAAGAITFVESRRKHHSADINPPDSMPVILR